MRKCAASQRPEIRRIPDPVAHATVECGGLPPPFFCRLPALMHKGDFSTTKHAKNREMEWVQVEQIKCSDAKLQGSYTKTKPAPGLSATCTSLFSRLFECFVVELPCGVAEASAPDVERVSKPVRRRVCGPVANATVEYGGFPSPFRLRPCRHQAHLRFSAAFLK